jgi:hypothetical protein
MRWRSVRAQRSVDRGRAGGAIEPRNPNEFGVLTLFSLAEGHAAGGVIVESLADPARSENLGTHDELHAREPGELVVAARVVDDAPSGMVRGVADQRWAGRGGNASGGNPSMNDREQSDRPVLPANSPNNPGRPGGRWGREGVCPRGARPVKHAPDAVPEKACPVIWIVCAKRRG